MKVRIEIDTKTFVRFWLVVIAFAFVILSLYLAKTALIIIATAAFLAPPMLTSPCSGAPPRITNFSKCSSPLCRCGPGIPLAGTRHPCALSYIIHYFVAFEKWGTRHLQNICESLSQAQDMR